MSLDSWLIPPRAGIPELIDDPATPWSEVLKAMEDVQRINGILGTYPIMLSHLDRLVRWPADRPLRVLDVATGLADIPRALVDWARRQGRAIEVIGLDLNPRILEMAKDLIAGYPEIRLVEGNALALPFEADSIDWALCHCALHHFPTDTHGPFFRELNRVVRPGGGIMVGDLVRSRLYYMGAVPFLSLVASPIGKRDGLASILNALSIPEVDQLLADSGLDYVQRQWLTPLGQFLAAGVKPTAVS
jgi:ubiquinone/menaquinone biosynthesis C-methylase UbiE